MTDTLTDPGLTSPGDAAPLRFARWLGRSSFVRAALVAGGGLFTMATLLLVRPDLMLVEHVVFAGNMRANPVELRHLVDVRNGTTMFGVDLGRASAGAQLHPWVRHATAFRQWPATVVVKIDEYVPVALLERDGLWYVSADGDVFLRARADDLDFPVITGLDPALERSHPDLPTLVVHDGLALLHALDARDLVSRSRISEVSFSATHGWTVHVVGGARVIFDLDGRERQLARLAALLKQGVDLDKPVLVDLAPESLAIVRPLDVVKG